MKNYWKTLSIALFALTILVVAVLLFQGSGDTEGKADFGSFTKVKMELNISPEDSSLSAEVELNWKPGRQGYLYFILNKNLNFIDSEECLSSSEIIKIADKENYKSEFIKLGIDTSEYNSFDHLVLYSISAQNIENGKIRLSYSGKIHDDVEVAGFSRWEIADETTGLIDSRGAFLTPWTGYYPVLPQQDTTTRFETKITVPQDWQALVEGKQVNADNGNFEYDSEHPIDGSYLVAGPYKFRSIERDGIEVGMYYYENSEDLVDKYLNASADYLSMYNELIGKYPYSRFSVVENWFPTGYGMPTYTLLGSQVLRLPFIIYTSLGHEIAHNWWGNGVFVDYKRGNWCEGLTVYSADYYYKKQQNADKQYRMETLRDYSEYVSRGDEEDFPLSEFTSRTTAGTRTIGYGKSMMVFHMLEGIMGEDKVWESLRKLYKNYSFKKISWLEIEKTFESVYGKDLDWYFQQWIYKEGAPQLALENVTCVTNGDGKLIEFDLRQVQASEPYRIDVPFKIVYKNGEVENGILKNVRGHLYHARVAVKNDPQQVEIDPDFNLFRVLDPLESPATLAGFYSNENPLVVINENDELKDAYREFAEGFFKRSQAEIISLEEYENGTYNDRSCLILGESKLSQKAMEVLSTSNVSLPKDGFALVAAFRDELEAARTHVSIKVSDAGQLAPLLSKLPHYGKYSYLIFESGNNIGKGQWEITESPLIVTLP